MKKDIDNFLQSILLAICYGGIIVLLQVALYKLGLVQFNVNAANLVHFDANVYLDIAKYGYRYSDAVNNNAGCFILFSWLWRILHCSVWGICIANYIFFSAGFAVLASLLKIDFYEKLLWLSIPTVYLMIVPYTEALFFFLISCAFYGIVRRIWWFLWVSLLLASLTRATALFLLPSFLVMELMVGTKENWMKSLGSYTAKYLLPLSMGLVFFVWYQHQAIGIWFAYFIQQQNAEGHAFAIPSFPLSSMHGYRVLLPGAVAVLVCIVAVCYALKAGISWLRQNVTEPNELMILSTMVLAMTLYKTIFYNPQWTTGRTLTIGITRYVFCTPFFYVFLNRYVNSARRYPPADYVFAFLLCNFAWMVCGEFVVAKHLIIFNALTAIVFLYMGAAGGSKLFRALLVVFNIAFQTAMFQQYLAGLYFD